MKSRFLASTTVVLALLLGLVSSNLLAQISDASSVQFQMRTYSRTGVVTGGWQTASANLDTVGRKADFLVKFQALQPLTSVDYSVTFPRGAVLNSTVADSVYIRYDYKDGGGNPQTTQFKVDPSRITVVSANDTAGYSESMRPQVRVTDVNTWSTDSRTVTVLFYKGIWLGKSVTGTNEATAVSNQKRMKLTLNHSITDGGTYTDSTNFYVRNDLADGVRLNTAVTAILNNNFLANGDSLVFVDRFGNLVPNFMESWGADRDTLVIRVSGTSVGEWRGITPTFPGGGPASNAYKVGSWNGLRGIAGGADSTTVIFHNSGTNSYNVATTTAYSNDHMFHALQPAANIDGHAVILFMGENAGLQTGKSTAGLKFAAASGVDTVQFIFNVRGVRSASGTVLNTAAGRQSTVTRSVSTASTAIGSLAMSFTPSSATYNGLRIGGATTTWTMTLKNIFGDPFNAQTIGTGTDSIRIIFKYRRQGVVHTAMTTMLQAGGQVTSKYTRPASRLYDGALTAGTFTAVSGGEYGVKLKGLATSAAGVVTLANGAGTGPDYLGTTSHPQRDSIYVVAYAWNNPSVRDSFLINVEPSPPITFDLDTLSVNLAAANAASEVIRGASIPRDLPIFALDTAYNRVSNMDLNSTATFPYLAAQTINGSGSIRAINLLVDGRDPTGYSSLTVTDSIRLDSLSIGARGALGAFALNDSSYIYHYNFARADSSRLNFGATGNAKMGLRLKYLGNRVVAINWTPGRGLSDVYPAFANRTLDLGIFELKSETLIDSVTNVTVPAVTPDTVQQRMARIVTFDIATGKDLGPNQADSMIYIAFNNLPEGAGIPDNISKDSVRVSADGATYYGALAISQVGDSLAIATPINLTAPRTVYVRIHGFVNPTKSDTSYGVRVSTKANPIVAKRNAAWTVNDGELGSLKLVAVTRSMRDLRDSTLAVLTGVGSRTVEAGDTTFFRMVFADRFGNILEKTSTFTRSIVIKSVDSTSAGRSLGAGQYFNGSTTPTTGKNMYDTLSVATDSLTVSTTPYYFFGDSVWISPAASGSYYVVFTDRNAPSAKDSVLLTVPGAPSGPSNFTFVTKPDSLVPDTANAQSVSVKVTDGDGIKSVSLITYSTALVLGEDGKFTMAATTDTVTQVDSSMISTKPDSINVTFSIPKKALGTYVSYKVSAVDAGNTSETSGSEVYVVAPKRGKSRLGTAATNVADIMRLVYLVLDYATPTTVDYFGLDLDQDGQFTGDVDLVQILAIWRGTGTALAAAAQEPATAKVALSMKEIDKANANLFIDLDNKGELNLATFQIKYDATKYSFGEVARTARIENNVQVVFNNKTAEGILNIVVINLEGRSISSGNGAILSIPVQALNGKFDGTGEIVLLSAGFEDNVQTDLNKEALSPKALLPKAFALGQNYPNPFNPSTTIAYDIAEGNDVQVRLNIYNIRGQLVRTLVDESKSEGSYLVQWDGTTNNGQQVSSGVYFYRLQAGDFNQTRKMVILK